MRSHGLSRWFLGALGAVALSVAAPDAVAQQQTGTIALNRFDPAPAGDRMFGVPSPFGAGSLTPHVMMLVDYAHQPLVLRRVSDDQSMGAIVANQLFFHLNGGVSLWNRVNVNLDVPVALLNDGDSPVPDSRSAPFLSPSKADLGDLRLGLRVRLYGEYFDAFQIAIGGYFWLPTGAKTSFVSDGTVRGLPQAIVGGRTDRIVYSAAVGPEIRKAQDFGNVAQGTMLEWGAGLGVLLLDSRHLQLALEANGALGLRDVGTRTNNLELLGHVRYRIVDDLEVGVGAGPGLSSGIGTPAFRTVAMIAYSPEPKQDKDGDGIRDREDACPDTWGVPSHDPARNGCPPPPPDRDGDQIVDEQDACPDARGVADPDPKKNGCPPPPPDRDGDGVADAEDACPDVKGVSTKDPKTNGCSDTDGDGIFDPEDACPDKPGKPDADPKKNGCPLVHVTATEVLILEQVQFDVDRATIKKVSDPLLDSVAKVLAEHAELIKLEVQGHTDGTGNRVRNKQLSQARAEAVKRALIKRGIDKRRLAAVGYGPDKPIADNTTDAGKQKNRRVQFVILEKKAR